MQVITTVNDAATRERLSAPAIRGFLQLANVWRLSGEERIDLLGASVSRSTLGNWADGRTSRLSADELMRISLLLAIHEGLERIWRRAPAEADAWVRRRRADQPFGGLSPLELMRERGIPGLFATRMCVDGMTGGPPSRADYAQPARAGL